MAGSNPVIAITSENEFDTWIEKSQDILLGEFDRECRALCYSSKVCFASPVYVSSLPFSVVAMEPPAALCLSRLDGDQAERSRKKIYVRVPRLRVAPATAFVSW